MELCVVFVFVFRFRFHFRSIKSEIENDTIKRYNLWARADNANLISAECSAVQMYSSWIDWALGMRLTKNYDMTTINSRVECRKLYYQRHIELKWAQIMEKVPIINACNVSFSHSIIQNTKYSHLMLMCLNLQCKMKIVSENARRHWRSNLLFSLQSIISVYVFKCIPSQFLFFEHFYTKKKILFTYIETS